MIKKWFNNAQKSIRIIVGQKLVEHYLRLMGKVLNEELTTINNLLHDEDVQELVEAVADAINQNKAGVGAIKTHIDTFIQRVTRAGEDDPCVSAFETVNQRLVEIWGGPKDEPTPTEQAQSPQPHIVVGNLDVTKEMWDLVTKIEESFIEYPDRQRSIDLINKWIVNGRWNVAVAEMKDVLECQTNLNNRV